MNFLSRTRITKIEQASDTQPGMLETMIKRLYIRRFPQLENLASSVETHGEKRVARSRPKKPAVSKRK
jgi:hypothetical protein